jgi:DNA (cytosine-5)-methyltransferase 1
VNFYNENDPKAAAWLRELIKAGEIPEGKIDERSITEIKPDDLAGFTQCHFFAGIGGWSLALRLAGFPATRPVWTASLPCQPFSTAGQSQGVEDERHLWPVFFDLVKVCRPNLIFGEQVARAIGFNWLDGISADLEGEGYAIGQAVLGAHSVGAPHKRQRLYWVANAWSDGRGARRTSESRHESGEAFTHDGSQVRDLLGYAKRSGLEGFSGDGNGSDEPGRIEADSLGSASKASTVGELADMQGSRLENNLESWKETVLSGVNQNGAISRMEHLQEQRRREILANGGGSTEGTGNAQLDRFTDSSQASADSLGMAHPGHGQRCAEQGNKLCECDSRPRESGAWSNYDLIYCRDDKFRRVETGTFPLAHGVSGRVGLLRGYGNAIVPQLAAEFIKASIEALNEL